MPIFTADVSAAILLNARAGTEAPDLTTVGTLTRLPMREEVLAVLQDVIREAAVLSIIARIVFVTVCFGFYACEKSSVV